MSTVRAYTKRTRSGIVRVGQYNRSTKMMASSLFQANRHLGLGRKLTNSVFKRGLRNISPKRLNQIDRTIQDLNNKGYKFADKVMAKKSHLQKVLKKSRYGLGYKLP